MNARKLGLFVVVAATLGGVPALAADQPSGADFVNVFNKIYGAHAGYRANHAKGILADGTFTPTPGAAKLSKAAIFAGPAVPVTVRFSASGGLPDVADADPNSLPKGMAVKFKLADGTDTDIVCISPNAFPAATPREFYDFLVAISESGPDVPAPKPVDKFLAGHPAAKHFVTTMPPPPVSYATQSYHGINAFKFVDAKGGGRYVRYFLLPVAGESHIDPKTAKLPPNYLEDELATRLKKGPIEFRWFAQVAAKGDPTNDGTKLWPKSRPMVELGTISITGLVADGDKAQRQLLFTPVNLTDGIEESDDPMIDARGNAYAESYGRRVQ